MADYIIRTSPAPQPCRACGCDIEAGEAHYYVTTADIAVHADDECCEALQASLLEVIEIASRGLVDYIEPQLAQASLTAILRIVATVQHYFVALAEAFGEPAERIQYNLDIAQSTAADLLEDRHPELYAEHGPDDAPIPDERTPPCYDSLFELSTDQRHQLSGWLSTTLSPKDES